MVRAYSNPCGPPCGTPGDRCANVDASTMFGTTAPVLGSGGWPACTARVEKPPPPPPEDMAAGKNSA